MDQKAPEAFRTISEVADELDVPQHVLRFWETRFHEIRPMKRGGGRRYYRPDDVDLLRGIRHLLYGEGYTIRGVQRILSEEGQKFVQAVWQSGAPQPPHRGGDAREAEYEDDIADDETEAPPPQRFDARQPPQIEPRFEPRQEVRQDVRQEPRLEPRPEPRVVPPVVAPAEMPDPNIGLRDTLTSFIGRDLNAREGDVRREPVIDPPQHTPQSAPFSASLNAPMGAPMSAPPHPSFAPQPGYAPAPAYPGAYAPQTFPHVPPVASPYAPHSAQPVAPQPPHASDFSRDDLRRLQAALHELAECKKLLAAMSGA